MKRTFLNYKQIHFLIKIKPKLNKPLIKFNLHCGDQIFTQGVKPDFFVILGLTLVAHSRAECG